MEGRKYVTSRNPLNKPSMTYSSKFLQGSRDPVKDAEDLKSAIQTARKTLMSDLLASAGITNSLATHSSSSSKPDTYDTRFSSLTNEILNTKSMSSSPQKKAIPTMQNFVNTLGSDMKTVPSLMETKVQSIPNRFGSHIQSLSGLSETATGVQVASNTHRNHYEDIMRMPTKRNDTFSVSQYNKSYNNRFDIDSSTYLDFQKDQKHSIESEFPWRSKPFSKNKLDFDLDIIHLEKDECPLQEFTDTSYKGKYDTSSKESRAYNHDTSSSNTNAGKDLHVDARTVLDKYSVENVKVESNTDNLKPLEEKGETAKRPICLPSGDNSSVEEESVNSCRDEMSMCSSLDVVMESGINKHLKNPLSDDYLDQLDYYLRMSEMKSVETFDRWTQTTEMPMDKRIGVDDNNPINKTKERSRSTSVTGRCNRQNNSTNKRTSLIDRQAFYRKTDLNLRNHAPKCACINLIGRSSSVENVKTRKTTLNMNRKMRSKSTPNANKTEMRGRNQQRRQERKYVRDNADCFHSVAYLSKTAGDSFDQRDGKSEKKYRGSYSNGYGDINAINLKMSNALNKSHQQILSNFLKSMTKEEAQIIMKSVNSVLKIRNSKREIVNDEFQELDFSESSVDENHSKVVNCEPQNHLPKCHSHCQIPLQSNSTTTAVSNFTFHDLDLSPTCSKTVAIRNTPTSSPYLKEPKSNNCEDECPICHLIDDGDVLEIKKNIFNTKKLPEIRCAGTIILKLKANNESKVSVKTRKLKPEQPKKKENDISNKSHCSNSKTVGTSRANRSFSKKSKYNQNDGMSQNMIDEIWCGSEENKHQFSAEKHRRISDKGVNNSSDSSIESKKNKSLMIKSAIRNKNVTSNITSGINHKNVMKKDKSPSKAVEMQVKEDNNLNCIRTPTPSPTSVRLCLPTKRSLNTKSEKQTSESINQIVDNNSSSSPLSLSCSSGFLPNDCDQEDNTLSSAVRFGHSHCDKIEHTNVNAVFDEQTKEIVVDHNIDLVKIGEEKSEEGNEKSEESEEKSEESEEKSEESEEKSEESGDGNTNMQKQSQNQPTSIKVKEDELDEDGAITAGHAATGNMELVFTNDYKETENKTLLLDNSEERELALPDSNNILEQDILKQEMMRNINRNTQHLLNKADRKIRRVEKFLDSISNTKCQMLPIQADPQTDYKSKSTANWLCTQVSMNASQHNVELKNCENALKVCSNHNANFNNNPIENESTLPNFKNDTTESIDVIKRLSNGHLNESISSSETSWDLPFIPLNQSNSLLGLTKLDETFSQGDVGGSQHCLTEVHVTRSLFSNTSCRSKSNSDNCEIMSLSQNSIQSVHSELIVNHYEQTSPKPVKTKFSHSSLVRKCQDIDTWNTPQNSSFSSTGDCINLRPRIGVIGNPVEPLTLNHHLFSRKSSSKDEQIKTLSLESSNQRENKNVIPNGQVIPTKNEHCFVRQSVTSKLTTTSSSYSQKLQKSCGLRPTIYEDTISSRLKVSLSKNVSQNVKLKSKKPPFRI